MVVSPQEIIDSQYREETSAADVALKDLAKRIGDDWRGLLSHLGISYRVVNGRHYEIMKCPNCGKNDCLHLNLQGRKFPYFFSKCSLSQPPNNSFVTLFSIFLDSTESDVVEMIEKFIEMNTRSGSTSILPDRSSYIFSCH